MRDCVDDVDICVIRGDGWAMDVGLSDEWTEVADTPGNYTANLVFRDRQNDDLTPLLTLTVSPTVDPAPVAGEPQVYFHFIATAAETSSLPNWNIVAYCELVEAGPPAVPTRLFNSPVTIND